MPSNYLRLALGEPLEVALLDPVGTPTESPNGSSQVAFRVNDGRTLYATPFQAGKIKRLNPIAGDWIRLTMTKVDGKSITQAERISPPIPGRPGIAPPAAHGEQTNNRQSHPTPIRGARLETMTQLGEVLVNGLPPDESTDPGPGRNAMPKPTNGHSNGHAANVPDSLPAARPDGYVLQFYTDAVDIAIQVQKYAELNNLRIVATFEDVRAIAATSRIDAQKSGGFR